MTAFRTFARRTRTRVLATLAICALLISCDDGVSPIQLPTLTSVSPAGGVRGVPVNVTLTGTNFITGFTQVLVSGAGINVTNVQVASETSVLAVLIIAGEADLGAHQVTVSTLGGVTEPQTFTVEAAPPTLTSVAPAEGVQGTAVPVTLTGTNFLAGATQVGVSGTGVTVSNVQVTGTTTLTATLMIAAGATLGDRNVTVSTAGGASGSRTFTVRPPLPTLTALSATTGPAGTNVSQTLTGTNFVAGATVAVSGTGVVVANVQVVSSTSITATFQIAAGAAQGNRNVTVTTSGGNTGARIFTVGPPLPTLTSLSVIDGVPGAIISQTLTGTNFLAGATVTVDGSGVTVSDVVVVSATSITATFTVGSAAAPGARNVRVVTAGGTSNARTFTVPAQLPTLTTLSPVQGAPGTSGTVTMTGTNFVTGATTISVSGDGVTVSNIDVVSGTSLTATFAVAAGATLGARDVTLETVGGITGPQTFTVVAAPVIVTFTATPSSVTAGQSTQLAWTVTNATACSIDNGIGSVSCNGTMMVTPGATTTYNFTATGGGTTVLRAVIVTVAGG